MTDIQYNHHPKDSHYFITYAVSFVFLGLAFAALGPLLPSLAKHIGVSLGQISFIFTAQNLGYMLGATGGGRLYDRTKGHYLMILALALMIIMTFFTPLVPQIIFLFVVIFFLGVGQGLLDVGANLNLIWVYQSRVGPYMNGLHFFFGVGSLLSPIILQQILLLTQGALTWPFWTLAILYLPGLIGLFLLKSPVNPEKVAKKETASPANLKLVGLMMLLFFFYLGVEGGFGGWIYTYVIKAGVANETNAAYINALFWGALTIGRLISVPISKRIKPAKLLIGNSILSILSIGFILLAPVNPIMVSIGAAGLGLGISSTFPTLLVLGETRLKMSGSVTGLFFLGSGLGGMILPMLLGQIIEYVGTYQVMLTILGYALAGFLVLLLVILASNRAGEKERV